MKKYIIKNNNINEMVEVDNITAIMEMADDTACYNECDIIILDEEENEVALRKWYGVEYDEENEDMYCENPICFGGYGYYGDWIIL